MTTEHNYGIHATCKKNFHDIMATGFHKSQDNRYFGSAVYFYDKSFNGEYYANFHRQKILKHNHCEKDDLGVLIQANLSCDSEFILNISEEPLYSILKKVEQDCWEESDRLNLTYEEKKKRVNRRRVYFIQSLIPDYIENIAMLKAMLPYKRNSYTQGFVVYDTACIKSLKEIVYAS